MRARQCFDFMAFSAGGLWWEMENRAGKEISCNRLENILTAKFMQWGFVQLTTSDECISTKKLYKFKFGWNITIKFIVQICRHRNLGAVSNHAANPLDLFHLPALKQQYTWEVSKFADTVIFTMTMENMSMYDKRNSQFERKRPAIKCQY